MTTIQNENPKKENIPIWGLHFIPSFIPILAFHFLKNSNFWEIFWIYFFLEFCLNFTSFFIKFKKKFIQFPIKKAIMNFL